MLNIPPFKSCSQAYNCPHSDNCQGASSDRNTEFKCSFYNNGKVSTTEYRNPYDKTGNMKILNES